MLNNSGFSLLPTLFITSLLLSSALYANYRSWQSVRDSKDLITMVRARERALTGAMRASAVHHGDGSSFNCYRAIGASGEHLMEKYICSLALPYSSPRDGSPLLDGRWGNAATFSLIKIPELTLATDCIPSAMTHPLSPSSVRSRTTCTLPSGPLDRSITYPHNITADSPVALNGGSETTLYIRGATSLGEVMVTGNVMVKSLGDIQIEALVLTPRASLTLISLTGSVSIANYSGGPQMTIWGKEGIFLSTTHHFSGGALSPHLRTVLPLFIQ
jgi:hypothetical protein